MENIAMGKRMREIDSITIRERGIDGITLMENAGRGLAKIISEKLKEIDGRLCIVVCGGGNNGGDGYVAARLLREKGEAVQVYSTVKPESLHGDAKTNYLRYLHMGGDIILIENSEDEKALAVNCCKADVIVDALLGTGISREVKDSAGRVIEIINNPEGYLNGIEKVNSKEGAESLISKKDETRSRTVIAVDIPSGVGADDGKIYGIAVKADLTVTFQMNKYGMCVEPGRSRAGSVIVTDIGIPMDLCNEEKDVVHMIDERAAADMLPERHVEMNKGDAGKLLIVAGSPGMVGAAVLAAKGAYKSGAGLVKVAAAKEIIQTLSYQIPEALGLFLSEDVNNNIELISEEAKKYDAIVVGPGLGRSEAASKLVEHIIKNIDKPMLFDADAINIIAQKPELIKESNGKIIMTPHPGEMGRLVKKTPTEVNENRLGIAQSFANEYNVTLILKGAASIIAAPDGVIFINPTGNSAMATAGSGDVLSGITGAFLAAGLKGTDAAVLGAYVHGMSGDLCRDAVGEYGTTALDIATFTGMALKNLTKMK